MKCSISVEVPNELKLLWNREKYFCTDLEFTKYVEEFEEYASMLDKEINEGNIANIVKLIEEIKGSSSYEYLPKPVVYDQLLMWIDLVIDELLKMTNIGTNNEHITKRMHYELNTLQNLIDTGYTNETSEEEILELASLVCRIGYDERCYLHQTREIVWALALGKIDTAKLSRDSYLRMVNMNKGKKLVKERTEENEKR